MAIDRIVVGVLSVQGNFAEHVALVSRMGFAAKEVRTPEELTGCTHLILPGGESTTIRKMLAVTALDLVIAERTRAGDLVVLGVCAGAILLATKVTGRYAPEPLGLIDSTVDRNAYGTQLESFDADLRVEGIAQSVRASFIRAPIITRVGENVDVLSTYDSHPVFVRSQNVWAMTCHPEMRGEQAMHELFLRS